MAAVPSQRTSYWNAAMLGAVAGLRTMLPWALLATAANRPGAPFLQRSPSPARFLRSPVALIGFSLAAVGELVADQLPSTPSRLAPGALAGRLISGALASAVVCLNARRSPLTGMVIGTAAAGAGAVAGYSIRMTLGRVTGVPDHVWGAVEDIFALGLGALVLRTRLRNQ
ncbi:DUF4126 family protein [Nitrolancea hollandica]|uniref:DUF4126 domain-containing protein n=1 Tax=Nitrolancea hollandica Lb TaxID=1129897 RepID=I4EI46_9BACT|nr:DUF4126 family protein [Nitrolancea hollandica]CCF84358.1 conserved membrane hypothetical protein [Nitrolancea hollandica Lb]